MIRFPRYFEVYGGFNALAKSPYVYMSVAITAVCFRYFTGPKWWDLVLSVVPGLVGFSIAGVAIFVSLGSDKLRSVIAGKQAGEDGNSPFVDFMAMFTHFVVIQLLALMSAFVSKALYEGTPLAGNPFIVFADGLRSPFWLFGGFCFTYAVLLCVALAMEIFRLATMIDEFQTSINQQPDIGRDAASR